MARACKMLYHVCSPLLYKDCLVADIDTFVQDIESNPHKAKLLSKVSTLRLYHRIPPDRLEQKYGTYKAILSDKRAWVFCGQREHLWEPMVAVREAIEWDDITTMKEIWLNNAAKALQKAQKLNPGVLSKLGKVVMTGVGWKKDGDARENYAMIKYTGWPMIPRFLLALPSVEHYCQCLSIGPLGLNDRIYTLHPPKIFTFHPNTMLGLWDSGFCHVPPLIMRSVNRYMFDDYRAITSPTDTGETFGLDDMSRLFDPILRMLNDGHDTREDGEDDVAHTTIEIYNYIRHVNMRKVMMRLTTDGGDGTILPSDLRHIQSLLDTQLGKWKGRVILK